MARVQLETITHEQHKDALKLRNNTAINVRDLNMTFKWLDIGQRLVVLPDADVDWDTVEDEFHLEPVGFGGHLRRVQSPPRAYPVHGFIDPAPGASSVPLLYAKDENLFYFGTETAISRGASVGRIIEEAPASIVFDCIRGSLIDTWKTNMQIIQALTNLSGGGTFRFNKLGEQLRVKIGDSLDNLISVTGVVNKSYSADEIILNGAFNVSEIVQVVAEFESEARLAQDAAAKHLIERNLYTCAQELADQTETRGFIAKAQELLDKSQSARVLVTEAVLRDYLRMKSAELQRLESLA